MKVFAKVLTLVSIGLLLIVILFGTGYVIVNFLQ